MKLILATKNPEKIQEIQKILGELDIELIPMEQAGFTEEIVEDGKTFEENALIKARAVSNFTHEWTLADDAGVMIPALNNEPGVDSKTFAGKGTTADDTAKYVLERMKNIPKEKRQIVGESVMVLMHPNGSYRVFRGENRGTVPMQATPTQNIKNGNLYYGVFVPEGYTKTYAELSHDEKMNGGFRYEALQKVKTFLKNEVLKGD